VNTKKKRTNKAPAKKVTKGVRRAVQKAVARAGVRSAAKGGHIPAARYARDPKSVAARLREKIEHLLTLTSNCVVRAERNGATDTNVNRLRVAIERLESVNSALA
jgi:hypothetical protein